VSQKKARDQGKEGGPGGEGIVEKKKSNLKKRERNEWKTDGGKDGVSGAIKKG